MTPGMPIRQTSRFRSILYKLLPGPTSYSAVGDGQPQKKCRHAIAAELARPAETVRGWLRRFAERAEAVRSVFTVWLRAVDADPVMPDAAGCRFADAVSVIAAVATAVERRFALPRVSLADTAVAVSGGRLLAPHWPDERVQHEPTLPLTPIAP